MKNDIDIKKGGIKEGNGWKKCIFHGIWSILIFSGYQSNILSILAHLCKHMQDNFVDSLSRRVTIAVVLGTTEQSVESTRTHYALIKVSFVSLLSSRLFLCHCFSPSPEEPEKTSLQPFHEACVIWASTLVQEWTIHWGHPACFYWVEVLEHSPEHRLVYLFRHKHLHRN